MQSICNSQKGYSLHKYFISRDLLTFLTIGNNKSTGIFGRKLNLQYLCRKNTNRQTLNLIIDIGNNSAKFFLFNGNQIVLHTRRANDSYDILDEWSQEYDIRQAIVSSVIDITSELVDKFMSLPFPVIQFGHGTKIPLKIGYRTPDTLGTDRIAAAVGAWEAAPGKHLLVIDSGTAMTVDFIDRDGTFRGGNIAPGVKMRLKALHEYTGRLPLVSKEGELTALGHDTETAIRNGVINGICHEIDGYIEEFSRKYGEVFVFLTGGDEKTLKNHIKSRIFADRYLVAKGLNRILLENYNE